ncbi:DNA alkylation repair protein [Flagellimonas nanhaiensis]|uniref:DNA alkylation repair protein n=1 Tax=Flagellimonas nanhaiensis TaxID=2292706 RepID=A0A371JS48_9FLAO|nr:DNA alkylation repair protein [Allomuricauda nanhaiensis]RDY60641.1 DNA alkylation repair protein [Allomuricauda nanhaiensis]
MAELLKTIYSDSFFERFLKSFEEVLPQFDSAGFMKSVHDAEWESRELKQRMRHITLCLGNYLGDDYKKNVGTILDLVEILRQDDYGIDTLGFIFLPDFIEVYGQDEFEISMNAMETVTQFVSCEFAIRPFTLKNQEAAFAILLKWSKHQNLHVRRLSSEGCRPRLPWAMGLPNLKKDPSAILPILENLKNDESEYVRRSVANNVNDISKDHPAIAIDLVKKWHGTNPNMDWVAKHASRTLLKQGNNEIMQLFGFGDIDHIKCKDFKVITPKIRIGESLEFSFKLQNTNTASSKIRVEYGIYYQKANGTLSRKVFKISEKEYPGKSISEIIRKQSFKPITTRVYHLGKHEVSIILNGKEVQRKKFELI